MTSPEVLPVFKELYLVEVPAALGYYLCARKRGGKNKDGEYRVKSFHVGPFIEFERLRVTRYKNYFSELFRR